MSTLVEDVARGFTATPKRIPSVHFYDAEGSRLFERITAQPEYYLTETERGILVERAGEILDAVSGDAREPVELVELGAGSAYKTRVLIHALRERQAHVDYVPIDVSRAAIEEAQAAVEADHDAGVHVHPHVGRNDVGLGELDPDAAVTRLVLFLGSSIGNHGRDEAITFLRKVADALRPRDALLLGTDLVKSPDVLVPAYSDAAGVTAAFNLNLLHRINRELAADFDVDAFRHVAVWNPGLARMESYLEATRPVSAHVGKLDLRVTFEEGERLLTEHSHKYTQESVARLAADAGLRIVETWNDARGWFALHALRKV